MLYGQKISIYFVCLYVCMFVCLYVRVITYGHINEKGENKHTIWLKLYTLNVYPKLLNFAFGVKRDNLLMGLIIGSQVWNFEKRGNLYRNSKKEDTYLINLYKDLSVGLFAQMKIKENTKKSK